MYTWRDRNKRYIWGLMKDRVFNKDIDKKFEFDESVASVFDDMLSRSVPFYKEVQNLIVDLIAKSAKDKDTLLDLGSSTGEFLLTLNSKTKNLKLIGIDNSKPMLNRANNKAKAYGATNIEFIYADMLNYKIENFNYIVANYTLQFIRPLNRPKLVKKIYDGLCENGYFIFSEKVVFEEKKLDKDIIDIYYEYKKSQGYSEYEIVKKREALENVLIPFTIKENIAMCKEAGFKSIDTIFQWGNFVTFVAKK